MYKVFCFFSLLLCSMTLMAENNIFVMKEYAANVEEDGSVTVEREGIKLFIVKSMTFHDSSSQLFPPYSKFYPKIEFEKNKDTVSVNISCSAPGLVGKAVQHLEFKDDLIILEGMAVPLRKFHSSGNIIALYPQVFDGMNYCGINNATEVHGKMPSGISRESKFVLNGLDSLSEMTFSGTNLSIKFMFGSVSPRALSDLRSTAWSKAYNLYFSQTDAPSNIPINYNATIRIIPGRTEVEKKTGNTLESQRILFELDFENGFSAKSAGDGKCKNKNTPVFTEGVSGKGILCADGKVLEYSEAGNLDKEKGAVSMWVKALDIVDPYREKHYDRTLFTEAGTVKPGNNIFKLWKSTWGGFRFDLGDKESSFWGIYDIYNWTSEDWHHVVISWNSRKGVSMYLNGELVQSAELNKQKHGFLPLAWAAVPSKSFFIGASGRDGQNAWHGAVDEIKIFNQELNLSEVQSEYNAHAANELSLYLQDRYLWAGKEEICKVKIKNTSGKEITFVPEFTISSAGKGTLYKKGFPETTLAKGKQAIYELPLNLPEQGDYELRLSSAKGNTSSKLKVLSATSTGENGTWQPVLIKTIDAVNPEPGSIVAEGNNAVVNSEIGSYRETGPKSHARFALGFELEEINIPYLAVIRWPDNSRRSMEILYHAEQGKQSYQAPGGILAGDEFFPSGKIKEYKVVIWPRTKKGAFIFMCMADGYPAAVKDVKIYKLDKGLPGLPVHEYKGEIPSRSIGLFYEDPVIPLCFGSGNLFPDFTQTTDRLIEYMQWFGQDILFYPIVWYDGPLYGSEAEPTVTSRAVRLHPENYPSYLLKRFQKHGIKFNGTLNIVRLDSLDKKALTDEQAVFNGQETIVNMRYDNHLQLDTPWNTQIPRYNVLDPAVRKAIKEIFREIAERYGREPNFSGLTIFINENNIFSLGNKGKGGYNDINIRRFQNDTGIKIPCYDIKDTYRFAKTYQWLLQNAWKEWISWRCKLMHDLFRELADILNNERKDLRLYIYFAGFGCGTTFANIAAEYNQNDCSVRENLREYGLDIDLFEKDQNIEICTMDRVSQKWYDRSIYGSPMELESARSYGLIPEIGASYKKLPNVSSIFFDAYFEDPIGRVAPIKDLKKILPGTNETAWRVSAVNANTCYGLENYVAALNNVDALTIVKGGFAVGTLGIEDWIGRFARAYRALPATRFEDVPGLEDPIRVRRKIIGKYLYFYVLNRLPAQVMFDLELSDDTDVEDIVSGARHIPGQMRLEPYDLKVFRAPANITIKHGTAVVSEPLVRQLESLLETAKKNFEALKQTGTPVDTYKKFLDSAIEYAGKKKYARLYILLYESWAHDIVRLLDNTSLQEFLKVEKDYINTQNQKKNFPVSPITGSMKIDGILDESDWQSVKPITEFADFIKFKGKYLAKPVSEKVELRLLHDNKNLYMGILCHDPETDQISVKKGLKDGSLWANDDSVEFFLKGNNAGKGVFAQLLVNAGSSKTDIFGGGADRAWDIEWQAQSKIIPGVGWTCEIAIPLDRIGKTSTNKLLFNIARNRSNGKAISALLLTDDNSLFCEAIWAELDFTP